MASKKLQLMNMQLSVAIFLLCHYTCEAQSKIALVSDTQAPMWIESILLKPNQNERATEMVFTSIQKQMPTALFILGDVVSLGHKEKKWKKMDVYLAKSRQLGIPTYALLGNHDVMGRPRKGEKVFQKRFPNHSSTGYQQTIDSVRIILLNSNFSKLSKHNFERQQRWYDSTLRQSDADPSVLAVIVTCHHSPFSNSKVVGSSRTVQKNFMPSFLASRKGVAFISGHSHNFERFSHEGKTFLVIGGGGGLRQPLGKKLNDLAPDYKPSYHYLLISRQQRQLQVQSYYLKEDFSDFEKGLAVEVPYAR